MNFWYILPGQRLKDYIDYYLVGESGNDESNLEPVIVYPKPHAEMVFNYGDKTMEQVGAGAAQESSNWAVSGFFTKKTSYYTMGRMGAIMVGFKPWGIQSFINFHTEEITNTNLDLKLVYPVEMRRVEEKLMEAESTLQRINIIETFLLSVLKDKSADQLVIGSLQAIFEERGNLKIRNLSKDFYLSEKQFVRRFKLATGVTPKFFSRLVRFQYIVQLLDNGRLDLLGHAIQSGLYDQSHFINEFTEFTGTSPLQYLKENVRTNLGRFFDENIEQFLYYYRIYQ